MKVKLESLGVIQQAEFELGDLTLICGSNNTGKTYATYALFGFLSHWRRFLRFDIPRSQTDSLLAEGSVHIDIRSCIDEAGSILNRGCRDYGKELPTIFASKPTYFRKSSFQMEIQPEAFSDVLGQAFKRVIGPQKTGWMSLLKEPGKAHLIVSLLLEAKTDGTPPVSVIKDMISDALIEIIFGRIFPDPFIASAERTGAAIFRKELNFARNRFATVVRRNGPSKSGL